MFIWIDDFLLRKSQKLCDAFTRFTGHTKFRLQVLCIWGTVLARFLYLCAGLYFDTSAVASSAVLLLFGAVMVRQHYREERNFLSGTLPGVSSFQLTLVRLLIVGLASLNVGISWLIDNLWAALWFTLSELSLLIWLYVIVCFPRPPGKSKMREWCEKSLSWLNDRLPEVPAPVRA